MTVEVISQSTHSVRLYKIMKFETTFHFEPAEKANMSQIVFFFPCKGKHYFLLEETILKIRIILFYIKY